MVVANALASLQEVQEVSGKVRHADTTCEKWHISRTAQVTFFPFIRSVVSADRWHEFEQQKATLERKLAFSKSLILTGKISEI